MRRIIHATFLFFASHVTVGQSMTDILKLLPKEHLNGFNIDSLINDGTYYPRDNSPEEIIKYTLSFNDTAGILRLEMGFETGQAGFSNMELKRLKKSHNEYIVIHSITSGTKFVYDQFLSTYLLKKGRLSEIKGLLPNVTLSDFVRADTPNSALKNYQEHFNILYEFTGPNICVRLIENFDPHEIDGTWLSGDTIDLIFNKKRFKKMPPRKSSSSV